VRIALPRDVSLDGHLVDGALGYLTLTTGIAFAALVLMLVVTLLFHRSRGGRRQPFYTHGNRIRDHVLTFALGLTLFVAIDVTLATRSTRDLRDRFWRYPDGDPNALRVEVTARQWSWTFRTAGPDGRFATADDVITLNELHVPVGRPVYLKLRARDVIHSFYLPNFRTKIDAIPGSTTRLWFQARETGRFEIGCAQHCGVSHYKMRGQLAVESAGDYTSWLARAEIDSRLRQDQIDQIDQTTPPTDGWDWETGR
jgi:cytochrome c oxidase subunit 2